MKKIFTYAKQCEASELWKRNLTCHVMIVDHKANFICNGLKKDFTKKTKQSFLKTWLTTGSKSLLLFEILYIEQLSKSKEGSSDDPLQC